VNQNPTPMIITKGNEKFNIIDINGKEMGTIYDAFMNGRHYLLEIQKTKDKELAKALGVTPDKIPELRETIVAKIAFYEKHIKKILTYEQK